MPLTIRSATTADMPAITAIYNEAGVGTTASYDLAPVSVAERLEWFEAKQRHQFPVFVAEYVADDADPQGSAPQVVGFASYGAFRDKAGYAFTVEHSVYVTTDRRAGGVGRMLMSALIDAARGRGVHVMVGAIDANNEASIKFHEQLGFTVAGRLDEVGRKFGHWLDVVFMTLTFEDSRID
ncbi:N-acetyltransferase family protein [Propionibacteriaceae bacterium G1746]